MRSDGNTTAASLDEHRRAIASDDEQTHLGNALGEVLYSHFRHSTAVVVELCTVVEACLTPAQMQSYLSVLFDVLLDAQQPVAAAAATLLRRAISLRGALLQQEVINEHNDSAD